MSPLDPTAPPNPAGSAIEKFIAQRRHLEEPGAIERALRGEGIDPSLAAPLGRALAGYARARDYQYQELLAEFERWANTHTHPGGGSAGTGAELPPTALLYMGGLDANGVTVDSVFKWDDTTKWSTHGALDVPLRHLSAVSVRLHGYVYIFGGHDGAAWRKEVRKYSVSSASSFAIAGADFPGAANRMIRAISDGSRYVYIVGGSTTTNADSYSTTTHPDVKELWRFDTDTETWVRLADLPFPFWRVAGVYYSGVLYCTGERPTSPHAQTVAYEIGADSWTTLSAPPGSHFGNFLTPLLHNDVALFPHINGTSDWVEFDPAIPGWTGGVMTPASSSIVESSSGVLAGEYHQVGGRSSGTPQSVHYRRLAGASSWTLVASTERLPAQRTHGGLVPVQV